MIFSTPNRSLKPFGSIIADDDAASTSSTFSANCTEPKKSADQQLEKKSVKFDLTQNVEYTNHNTLDDGEVYIRWYQGEEYREMKYNFSQLAKRVACAEMSNPSPQSYKNTIERVYQNCCQSVCPSHEHVLSDDEQVLLRRWYEIAPNRTGLERHAVRAIRKDGFVRRREAVAFVLEIQESPLQCDSVDMAEVLRDGCVGISRPSVLFATCIARASGDMSNNHHVFSEL